MTSSIASYRHLLYQWLGLEHFDKKASFGRKKKTKIQAAKNTTEVDLLICHYSLRNQPQPLMLTTSKKK